MPPPPIPGAAPPPAPLAQAEWATLNALGFRQWQPAPRAATMQDLVDLAQRSGALRRSNPNDRRGTLPRYDIDLNRISAAVRPGGPFQHLAPLFAPVATQQVYNIAQGADPGPSNYVGRTNRPPGERLLEHLFGTGGQQVDTRLRRMVANHDRSLRDMHIFTGSLDQLPASSDQTRRAHLGEVALIDLHQPAWMSPTQHGFEEGEW